MPWVIKATGGQPDFRIWDAELDKINPYRNKTVAVANPMGWYLDANGNPRTWDFYDVDGNHWQITSNRIYLTTASGVSYSGNRESSYYAPYECGIYFGRAIPSGEQYFYKAPINRTYQARNDCYSWYGLTPSDTTPSKTLVEFWEYVYSHIEAGKYAFAITEYNDRDTPYVILDCYNNTSDAINMTGSAEGLMAFWNTASGLFNNFYKSTLLQICPSAVYESPSFERPDPYENGGHSEPYIGEPTFDGTSDQVPVPDVPTFSFSDSGFTRIYNPNVQQLRDLAHYMWTDQTFLQTLVNHAKQLLDNPIDAIIALNLLPCPIDNGTAEEVKILYIPTGVYMPPATNQFVSVDCGSVDIDTYYASALDYSPYTTIELVLPFIGQVSIDTDEVMGKTMHVRYRVDIVTGMCIALVSVDGTDEDGQTIESVLYQFTGHCAIAMPITSADFSAYIAAAIGAAKTAAAVALGAASGVAAGIGNAGLSALESAGAALDSDMPRTEEGAAFGAALENKNSRLKSSSASYLEMAHENAVNTVSSVMSSKPVVQHSGGFTGNSGYMGVRRPYVIIKRPRMCNPNEYGKYNGYPSMMYLNLGDLTGYTKVQEIQLTGIPATNPELGMIATLLKNGVIL